MNKDGFLAFDLDGTFVGWLLAPGTDPVGFGRLLGLFLECVGPELPDLLARSTVIPLAFTERSALPSVEGLDSLLRLIVEATRTGLPELDIADPRLTFGYVVDPRSRTLDFCYRPPAASVA